MAWRDGLDLVEVSGGNPPVCSIMDFGKHLFEEKKRRKGQKQQATAKEVRLRPVSSDHDVDIKINQLKKFLAEKRNVIVNIKFKNRELSHRENGRRIVERILASVEDLAKAETPRFEGSTLSVRLIPR